jgi:hypothetical protein
MSIHMPADVREPHPRTSEAHPEAVSSEMTRRARIRSPRGTNRRFKIPFTVSGMILAADDDVVPRTVRDGSIRRTINASMPTAHVQRRRWRGLAVAATVTLLGAAVIVWRVPRAATPDASTGILVTLDARPTDATASNADSSEDDGRPDAATGSERHPFAIEADASAEIRLPGWPGWPLPQGTTLTPTVFCEGATAPRLFVRNPKCSAAEIRADIERNRRMPFGGFGDAMRRSQVLRCIARVTSSVEKARVRLDPEAGERCIAAAIAVAFDVIPSPIDTAECNGYVIGLQQMGQPCTDPWECIDGLACVGFTRTKDGRCKPLPTLGAPCGNGEPDRNLPFDIGDRPACSSGARCFPWGGTCRRARRRGERCEQDWDCLEELACRALRCASKERVAAGGACLADAECAPALHCAGTDYTKTPGVCTEKRAAGEACTDDSECRGHCELDAKTPKHACVAWCQSG